MRSRFSATLFLMWVPTVTNVVFAYLTMQVTGRSGGKVCRCNEQIDPDRLASPALVSSAFSVFPELESQGEQC